MGLKLILVRHVLLVALLGGFCATYAEAEVKIKPGVTISGPGLPATYSLDSFHFHWGTLNLRGSEHAIDGLQYAMELHLVHIKNNLTVEQANQDPEGYAVLAFFIKVFKFVFLPAGNSVFLNGEFSLGALLNMADLSSYYHYHGSLTTPDCNESVIWMVFPDPIEVNNKTLKKFTNSLYFSTKREKRKMQKNYRPLQPGNKRQVFFFKENETPYWPDQYTYSKKY
ncbi:hypothetical protein JRQ81_006056 [Phrynocephalus forsythii]|uniref:Carbonic anhydrase n=1 Tax=Phrynocephalus forsythii TaxID=171643 RepID=A0A9Q0XHQ3_9SAUR|nr:hypothetical protein JRQ81_006056 [Phrynocephalus forsythii]